MLTVDEVARLTGLSRKAVQERVARGTLASERRGNRRVIPLEALYEVGLLELPPAATVADMLDRLERQAQRIGELEAEVRGLRSGGDPPP